MIADAEKPVAVAGVMGGEHSEVTDATVDVLLESAAFEPLSVRTTARRHHLHSPSSYRFERGVDVSRARLGQPPRLRIDSPTSRRHTCRRER